MQYTISFSVSLNWFPFITAQKCLKRDTMDQLTSFTILWNHAEVKLLETFSSLEKEAVS